MKEKGQVEEGDFSFPSACAVSLLMFLCRTYLLLHAFVLHNFCP